MKVLVLSPRTLGMFVTHKLGMETDVGGGAVEIIRVGARCTVEAKAAARVGTGRLTVVRVQERWVLLS